MNAQRPPTGDAAGGRGGGDGSRLDSTRTPRAGQVDRSDLLPRLRQYAQAYYEAGLPPVPLRRGKPLTAWRPFIERRPSWEEVERLPWAQADGVAVVLGHEALANARWWVLDIEAAHVAEAEAWLDAHRPGWREGLVAESQSGGLHLYLLTLDPRPSRRCAWGDVKAKGGLVYAPPTKRFKAGAVHDYRWRTAPDLDQFAEAAPVWARFLDPAVVPGGAGRADGSPTGTAGANGHQPFDVARVLAGVPHGERNSALFRLACKLRAADVPEEWAQRLVAEAAKNCSPPWGEQSEDRESIEALVARVYARYPAPAAIELPPDDGGSKAAPRAAARPRRQNFQLPNGLDRSVGSEVGGPHGAGGLLELTGTALLRTVGTGDAEPLPSLPLLGRDGYLIRGWSHLIAGYPRAGKTELLVACALAWAQAGERVLYLTEEPASLWAARLARRRPAADAPSRVELDDAPAPSAVGATPSPSPSPSASAEPEPDGHGGPNFQLPTALGSSVGSEVGGRATTPTRTAPADEADEAASDGQGDEPAAPAGEAEADDTASPLDRLVLGFALGVDPEQLLRRAVTGDETVIIVDTLRALLGIADETDNSAVAQALTPWIVGCRQMGKTLIMAHHERKGGGQHGEGIAGGHALLASFDVALELLRDGQHPDRRLIRPYARVIAPPELLYERTADGAFQALGDPEAVQRGEVRRRVRAALTETWQTTAEVWAGLDEPRPSRELVRAALQDLAQAGEVERDPDMATTKVQGRTLRWRLAGEPSLPRSPSPSTSEPEAAGAAAAAGEVEPEGEPRAAAGGEAPPGEAPPPPPPPPAAQQRHFQRTFPGGLEVGSWAGGDDDDGEGADTVGGRTSLPTDGSSSPPPGEGAPLSPELHFQRNFLRGLEVGSSSPPPPAVERGSSSPPSPTTGPTTSLPTDLPRGFGSWKFAGPVDRARALALAEQAGHPRFWSRVNHCWYTGPEGWRVLIQAASDMAVQEALDWLSTHHPPPRAGSDDGEEVSE